MHKTRSRLLIALVLFGVVSAAVVHAQSLTSGKRVYSTGDPSIKGTLQPGATPNAGEPDVTSGAPQRMSMTPKGGVARPAVVPGGLKAIPQFETFRWAWAIWMARYLNQSL